MDRAQKAVRANAASSIKRLEAWKHRYANRETRSFGKIEKPLRDRSKRYLVSVETT